MLLNVVADKITVIHSPITSTTTKISFTLLMPKVDHFSAADTLLVNFSNIELLNQTHVTHSIAHHNIPSRQFTFEYDGLFSNGLYSTNISYPIFFRNATEYQRNITFDIGIIPGNINESFLAEILYENTASKVLYESEVNHQYSKNIAESSYLTAPRLPLDIIYKSGFDFNFTIALNNLKTPVKTFDLTLYNTSIRFRDVRKSNHENKYTKCFMEGRPDVTVMFPMGADFSRTIQVILAREVLPGESFDVCCNAVITLYGQTSKCFEREVVYTVAVPNPDYEESEEIENNSLLYISDEYDQNDLIMEEYENNIDQDDQMDEYVSKENKFLYETGILKITKVHRDIDVLALTIIIICFILGAIIATFLIKKSWEEESMAYKYSQM